MQRLYIYLFIFLFFISFNLVSETSESDQKNTLIQDIKIFEKAVNIILKSFVEEPDHTKIIRGAINGMFKELNDAYSYYMPPTAHEKMMESLNSEFGGLGIQISIEDDELTIIAPLDETPAKRAGLKARDKIIKIEGVSTKGITAEEASKKMRGPKGTHITITIERVENGKKTVNDYTLTRDIIKIKMSRYRITEDGIGYLRLVQFTKLIGEETEDALKRLNQENIKGLILDLRHNPGGFLQSAVYVASCFTDEKKLVVFTKGRENRVLERYETIPTKSKFLKPLILLIDNGSASASEITAGALKDWGRAVLIGEKSFGKGSVQQVFNMLDNSGLRLTISKYYTPSERVIHNVGLEPDIHISLPSSEEIAKIIKEKKTAPEKKKELNQKEESVKETIIDNDINTTEINDTISVKSNTDTTADTDNSVKKIEKLEVEEYDTQLKFALDFMRMMFNLSANPETITALENK